MQHFIKRPLPVGNTLPTTQITHLPPTLLPLFKYHTKVLKTSQHSSDINLLFKLNICRERSVLDKATWQSKNHTTIVSQESFSDAARFFFLTFEIWQTATYLLSFLSLNSCLCFWNVLALILPHKKYKFSMWAVISIAHTIP